MYDDIVARLRNAAQWADKGLVITPSVCLEAANAIEELCGLCASQSKDCSEAAAKYLELWAKQPRWIPVAERLPEDLQNVLVIDDGRVTIGHCEHYYGDEQIYVEWHDTLYYPIDPPCWMPLPEPPKEEDHV